LDFYKAKNESRAPLLIHAGSVYTIFFETRAPSSVKTHKVYRLLTDLKGYAMQNNCDHRHVVGMEASVLHNPHKKDRLDFGGKGF
jgi:hypothetical protein